MQNNFLLFILFLIPFLAKAQLETYGRYTKNGDIEPNINYSGSSRITDKIALTFFGLVEQKWSEALVGIKYAPTNTFNFSGSIGIEQGTNSPRYSASIWTIKGKTSLLILGELGSGEENYLYKINLFHHYSDLFTLGLTAWRFHGVGPNVRFTIKKLSSTIWAMPAYDFESNRSKFMLGISTKM